MIDTVRSMVEIIRDRGGLSFVFDVQEGTRFLAAIGTWLEHASIDLDAFDCRSNKVVTLRFGFGNDDQVEYRKDGIAFVLSRDACDYALHKLAEWNRMGGFSTPEFRQFDQPKRKGTRVDAFLAVRHQTGQT
ncbi:hypothetical protein WK59_29865 [Burkholderia ubonensis]|uniref:hypothetical protein n=1 Tax=Burkholderia ubonensis TaxID=101571 RepID=UPI000753548D|nr:hypothetical protein [Burkholderia ubonensis]KVT95214.1 hypothetical protein WK59_29865 [Burkholderia ubonensis]